MEFLKDITAVESRLFERFQEPQYNYRIFEVLEGIMGGDSINDTPKGAFILGKQISEECLPEIIERCQYGFVVITGTGKVHCDLHILPHGNIGYSFRSPEVYKGVLPFDEKIQEIYKVVKRQL